jgi:hypothetical protein
MEHHGRVGVVKYPKQRRPQLLRHVNALLQTSHA